MPKESVMADAEVRETVRSWLTEHWDINRPLDEWRECLVDGGWAAPAWPVEFFGRGYSVEQAALVAQTFEEFGAVGPAQGGPRRLASHTLLTHGNDAQKQAFLRQILTGEHGWCQLFSEPGSGSDLAGLSTKAQRVGDRWIINGQKVWNTSAHHADYGLLLARTDWDVPKHQGLSYFLIDMHQPGVEVRPLRQMNGHASFNEVFFSDAWVLPEHLLGAEGEGWSIAATTLSIERQGFSSERSGGRAKNLTGAIYDQYRSELAVELAPYTWYPQRTGRVDLAYPRAKASGKIDDPALRQALAKLLSMKKSADLTEALAAVKQRAGNNRVSPEGSVGKLAASAIARQAAHVHTLISGAGAMLGGDDSAHEGVVAEILLSVPAISIAGGTDEIQKNIVAERVLGLPKEPRFDRGPFRDVPRNAVDN
ncbi:MAG: acyl-CoA dehydrogenase [Gammaproteobacteria bacterium]|jgi:alkylation response protein AidB-like acyl-CoA dehydrogenase|nr:acyl-CoA dehydrogenase [Gammaproteobacteria bacterium]